MKQWKAAAGLAGLASLVLVASLGWGSGSTDPSRSDQQVATTASAQAGAAGPGDSPYRASDRSGRATIALPAIQAGRPVPLRLARGTLERAWPAKSEERRVGKVGVRSWKFRWSPDHE